MPVEARAEKARAASVLKFRTGPQKIHDAEPKERIVVDQENKSLSLPTYILAYVLLDPTAK